MRYDIEGHLDGSFGALGYARTAVGSGGDAAIHALCIKNNGAIVAGGEAEHNGRKQFALACYSAGADASQPYWPGAFLRWLLGRLSHRLRRRWP